MSPDLTFSVDQDRLYEAKGLDRGCELLEMRWGVGAQGTFVGPEGVNRHILDGELQITSSPLNSDAVDESTEAPTWSSDGWFSLGLWRR